MSGSYVPVATTTRSGVVESVHHGAVVGLDPDGAVAFTAGDPDVEIYARSALKPLQAAAMLAAGLELPDRLLAVVCSSHDGRPEHVAAVNEILAGAGLSAAALGNTPTLPLDVAAADAVVRAGGAPSPVLQNCSGKHAGLLVTCVVNGWPTASYLDVDHPLQKTVMSHLDHTAGVGHVGVDGCGAPTAVVSLAGLARATRRLAVERGPIHRAMTDYPSMVGGPRRDVTRLMQLVPGLMAKDGAEGVYVAAHPDGRAVALKIADGASRARLPVMVAALRAVGVDVPAEADELADAVLGHGRPVGEVRAVVGR
jgi:L-asparaginase II